MSNDVREYMKDQILASDELYHSDVYLGRDFDEGLMHFKYIDRYKNSKGKWVYVYDSKALKNDINKAKQNVVDAANATKEFGKEVYETGKRHYGQFKTDRKIIYGPNGQPSRIYQVYKSNLGVKEKLQKATAKGRSYVEKMFKIGKVNTTSSSSAVSGTKPSGTKPSGKTSSASVNTASSASHTTATANANVTTSTYSNGPHTRKKKITTNAKPIKRRGSSGTGKVGM